MFEKTLTDIVKGIRASKRDTSLYISQCIAEIKTEIHSSDMYVKANALQKLTFLHMMGYSMNWASFATIEVMSSPRFAHKRVGYLAASQGFTQHTEVILLTTNLLKKELRGAVGGGMKGVYEAGLAINCVANIVTEDLATDLLPELTNLTQHPQPYLRKKSILCLYKVFIKYPQALRLTFARLQQCLEDSNSAVVSCAVNVITELSDKNPRNYLQLAPAFFQLLTESSNNWMLIKVVKLLGSLVPEEPRLARKLLEPLAKIVQQTQAKSLLYEAVYTITLCLPYCRKSDGSMPTIVPEIVTLCAQTLRTFVEEPDQNLKYLGLVGFGSLMKSHPRVLSASEYRPLILACLSDQDTTIRTRALDLLIGLVTRKNLVDLVTQLLEHVHHANGTYRHDLVAKIIDICRQDKYSLLQDFRWYMDVLFRLGHTRSLEGHAELLRAQITDVALRVLPVRAHAVELSVRVLLLEGNKNAQGDMGSESKDDDEEDDLLADNGRGKDIMSDILPAVAWIVGEYADLIPNFMETTDDDWWTVAGTKGPYHALIQSLTLPWNTQRLPTTTQKIYVQAALKVLAAASANTKVKRAELEACVETLHNNLPIYTQSTDVEVVERAFTGLQLLKSLGLDGGIPGLTAADDSDSDEGGGDLLGLDGKNPGSTLSSPPSSKSMASKVKEASSMLTYLFKPSPMKPIGAKAQRKKLSNPLGHKVDLNPPADLTIFSDLIDKEMAHKTSGTVLSIESVSFTQQKPRHVEEKAVIKTDIPMTGFGNNDSNAGSFQRPAVTTHIGSTSRQRQGDPFYLDSTPTHGESLEADIDKKLSTIQLGDSDDEGPKKGKKAKKKAKSKKDDFLEVTQAPTIYDSDDDDDEATSKQKKKSKEFDHLARIDLTTPLRVDEVMPERKHRTVATPAVGSASTANPLSSKKSKKEKKKSKKREAEQTASTYPAMDVDLLDLGGFGAVPSPAPNVADAAGPTNANPVNSAFDDLLTLSMPNPVQSQASTGDSFSSPTHETVKARDPLMKASLKISKQSGGKIDFSNVSMLYRVHKDSVAENSSISVSFRVQNGGSVALPHVKLQLKSGQAAELGEISQNGRIDSDQIGPLPLSVSCEPAELKGTLSSSTSSVPFKFTIPVTVFLTPEEASLDSVASDLSSGQWSSASSKIDRLSGLTATEVFGTLQKFFQAALVKDSVTENSSAFAAKSSDGARVRIFLKLKNEAAKLEIRCTSEALGSFLASDSKRVFL